MAANRKPRKPSNFLTHGESANHLADTELLCVTVLQHHHAVVVAHVVGEVDMLTGPSLQQHLDNALATKPERLIVDLSDVSFLGATGLAVVINAQRAATQQGTTLQLRGVSSAAALPLQITELAYLFEILPAVEEQHSGPLAPALDNVRWLRRS
jgi:anti-sigma B factor antagonist